MSKVDISSEAVERLGCELAAFGCPGDRGLSTLRAQAERIKELEATAKAPHLQTYWRERVASARNDALREAVQHIRDHAEVARKKMREAYDLGSRDVATTWSAIISHLDNEADAIAAMQKDAAMDRLVSEGQRCDAVTPQEAAPDWEGFGRAMMEHWPVRDVDGAELFDLSLKHGLIAEVPGGYDPEQHIDAEGISPETGDPWYEYTFREDSQ